MYPKKPDSEEKEGDPVADRLGYLCSLYYLDLISLYLKHGQSLHYVMDAVCHDVTYGDKTGWGKSSRDAAKVSAATFVNYFKTRRSDITSTRKAAKMCLRALFLCNSEIVKGASPESIFNCGF